MAQNAQNWCETLNSYSPRTASTWRRFYYSGQLGCICGRSVSKRKINIVLTGPSHPAAALHRDLRALVHQAANRHGRPAALPGTPFTLAALRSARDRGAVTIGLANNLDTPILRDCAHPIFVTTGAEAIAGSTRMKAGTAQKIVLNLLSTLIMIRLGRVYRGRMVAMRATNTKLRRRGVARVAQIAGCDAEAAASAPGLKDRGGLQAELRADIVVMDDAGMVTQVYAEGELGAAR